MQKKFVIKFEPVLKRDWQVVFMDYDTTHEESLIGAHKCMIDALDDLISEGFEPIYYTLEEVATRAEFEAGQCMISFKDYEWSWFFVESDDPQWIEKSQQIEVQ